MMKRYMLGVLVALLASVGTAQSLHAQTTSVTEEQLKAMAPNASDLGPGYAVQLEIGIPEGPGYIRQFVRFVPTMEIVQFLLMPSNGATPEALIQGWNRGAMGGASAGAPVTLMLSETQPIEHIASGARTATLSGTIAGEPIAGAIVSWVEGPVLVTVSTIAIAGSARNVAESVTRFATMQQARIQVALTQSSPPAQRTESVALPVVAQRTPESLQALLVSPADLGDGFSISDPTRDDRIQASPPAAFRSMWRGEPYLLIMSVTLSAEPSVTPAAAIESRISALPGQFSNVMVDTAAAPPGYPDGALTVSWLRPGPGIRYTGAFIAWRDGDVTALVEFFAPWPAYISADRLLDDFTRYSAAQRDKLRVGLPMMSFATAPPGQR